VEVAVELPFTIVFEPPSRSELRALLRMRGHWAAGAIVALTIGIIYLLAGVARADARATAVLAPLNLSSTPAGATVWVDGHQRGTTPLQVGVDPGTHSVLLKRANAVDQQYSLDVGAEGAALNAVLWRQQPDVTRLRPALPGARLADARLLDNGQVGLTLELPPGRELEAWRLDPSSGALEQVLSGTTGARLVFAADGEHLAYIGTDVGPASPTRYASTGSAAPTAFPVVWLLQTRAGAVERTFGWRPALDDREQLQDLSWSPQADHVLVAAGEAIAGGAALTRFWLVDAQGESAEQVLSIPSQVVPGTEAWSPDGSHIAFVAHAGGVNALCLLGTDGTFRYLADLDASYEAPLGVPAVSWSADSQRLVFVAPPQHLPGVAFNWLRPDPQHALYVATLDQPMPTGLADTQVDDVAWRDDGALLGLWRASRDATLHARVMNAAGGDPHDLLVVPLQAAAAYSAMWDLARANLLVVSRAASGGNDYWLARLGASADST
jgi:Tol biopolymer transport system component